MVGGAALAGASASGLSLYSGRKPPIHAAAPEASRRARAAGVMRTRYAWSGMYPAIAPPARAMAARSASPGAFANCTRYDCAPSGAIGSAGSAAAFSPVRLAAAVGGGTDAPGPVGANSMPAASRMCGAAGPAPVATVPVAVAPAGLAARSGSVPVRVESRYGDAVTGAANGGRTVNARGAGARRRPPARSSVTTVQYTIVGAVTSSLRSANDASPLVTSTTW